MSATLQFDDRPVLLWVARNDVLTFPELPGGPAAGVPDTPGEGLPAAGLAGHRSSASVHATGMRIRQATLP
jgi:hypothetical protein